MSIGARGLIMKYKVGDYLYFARCYPESDWTNAVYPENGTGAILGIVPSIYWDIYRMKVDKVLAKTSGIYYIQYAEKDYYGRIGIKYANHESKVFSTYQALEKVMEDHVHDLLCETSPGSVPCLEINMDITPYCPNCKLNLPNMIGGPTTNGLGNFPTITRY